MHIVQWLGSRLRRCCMAGLVLAAACAILVKPAAAQPREIGPAEEAARRAADARAVQEIQVARDVLAIMEGRLGRDHPDLATPLNNL